ncbi:MAG: ZIP family metal transporter [Planctomycetota bacterium]
MPDVVPLTYYSLLILAASVAGGMIPTWVRLTHLRMEVAVSFVAGVMMGVGMLHLLPHALRQAPGDEVAVCVWVLLGWLAMFFIERFFRFHHHELEAGEVVCSYDRSHDAPGPSHGHDLTWSGAALGLTLHSVIAGVALAASVEHGHATLSLPGLGTFLAILLHKPFDSMTIATLMARGGWSVPMRHAVNGLFALAIPVGVLIFHFGLMGGDEGGSALAYALAFSAGMFFCIAASDLLPELQFHDHDRGKLSAALLVGLAVAYAVCWIEGLTHAHPVTGA